MAAKRAGEHADRAGQRMVPLVAVPFMGDVGRRLCEEAGVGWLDLSGNAHVVAPGIRAMIGGQPNRYRAAGRPANLFAPKSSRVARWLLVHPDQFLAQREIARSTGMTEGFVSRIVARLEHEGYVVRDDHAAVRPRDPGLLLDAWREAYQFSKHTLHQGHVAARSGDTLLSASEQAREAQDWAGAAGTSPPVRTLRAAPFLPLHECRRLRVLGPAAPAFPSLRSPLVRRLGAGRCRNSLETRPLDNALRWYENALHGE